jgi:hypothetical protein
MIAGTDMECEDRGRSDDKLQPDVSPAIRV